MVPNDVELNNDQLELIMVTKTMFNYVQLET